MTEGKGPKMHIDDKKAFSADPEPKEAAARALAVQIVEQLSDGWGEAENTRAVIEIYPLILAALMEPQP